jgi:hypothetical protein
VQPGLNVTNNRTSVTNVLEGFFASQLNYLSKVGLQLPCDPLDVLESDGGQEFDFVGLVHFRELLHVQFG